MRFSAFFITALLAVIASPKFTLAQLSPWPAWADDGSLHLGTFSHPSLANVLPELDMESPYPQATLHGVHHIHWHSLHGSIAISQGETKLGSIATGLQFVFGVNRTKQFFDSPCGFYVHGIDLGGRSAVLHCNWNGLTPPQSLQFSPLIPPSPIGHIYTVCDIIDSYLYVVDAQGEHIIRFHDSNSDGLPDTLEALTPLPLGRDDLNPPRIGPRLVAGFYEEQGEHFMSCYEGGHDEYHVVRIFSANGNLRYSVDSNPALEAPRPHLRHLPVAGMKRIRIRYKKDSIVWVEMNGSITSNRQIVGGAREIATLDLKKPLVLGDDIVIKSDDGCQSGTISVIYPASPILFSSNPYRIKSGETWIFDGGNLSPSLEAYVGTNSMSPVLVQHAFVDSSRLVVDIPIVPSRDEGVVLIVNKADGEIVFAKPVVLLP